MLTVLALSLALALPPELDDGAKLYRAFEYEQARFRFQAAAVAPGLSPQERALCLAWLGLAQAGYGDLEAAKSSFELAVAEDPKVLLPEQASPKVTELFAQVKASAPKPAPEPSPPPAPPPNPGTTPTPAPSDDGTSFLVVPGAVGVGVGALLGVGAGVATALGFQRAEEAKDQTLFQVDARRLLDEANTFSAVGIGLGAAAGVLVVVGGAALVVGLSE